MKLEIGQTLYSYSFDKFGEVAIKEHTITKLGRKFLEVDENRESYFVENLKNKEFTPRYSPDRLYVSITAIDESIELSALMKLIKDRFSGYGIKDLTLDQARKIKSILEEK